MLKPMRDAFRMLWKNPSFTVIAICSLAIGTGATSACFSFADALLLRPLPILQPSRVLAVTRASHSAFGVETNMSYPDYRDLRDLNHTLDGLIAGAYWPFGFSRNATDAPKIRFGMFVSGNFFRVLGVEPPLGRGFRDSEDQAIGRDPVVVLGYDFWVDEFNGNPGVIGSKVRLGGTEFTVIGVAPEHFTGIDQFVKPTMFVPLAMSPVLSQKNTLEDRDNRWLMLKGRLKPGATVAQAQADLGAIGRRLAEMYPKTNRDVSVVAQTELELRVAQSPPNVALVGMLFALALCVLLVACANVTGLLLSRARARSREIAVRLAIGAGRGALIRQLMLENLLLALFGGLAGVAIAFGGVSFLNSIPIPTDLPLAYHVGLDQRMLIFTIAAAVASTLFFGLAPAMQTTRLDLVPALKAGDTFDAKRARLWGRNAIVIGQVALSLVLLVLSAVMLQGFRDELAQGPGFRTDHLYLSSFDTQPVHYTADQAARFYKDLLDRARAAPGVRSATLTSVVPLIGGDARGIVPEGYQLPKDERSVNVFCSFVSDGYFSTLGIPIVEGRGILETDGAKAPLVAVINQQTAKHFWPNADPIGKRFHLNNATGPLVQIVGIAKTTKYFWIAEPPLDFVYFPYGQNDGTTATFFHTAMTLVAESSEADASSLASVVRGVIRSIDPNMPTYDAHTMKYLYTQRAVKTPNILVETVAGMGAMGLLLAVVGLYGLVSYSVSRRNREIGVRMAIGANRQNVVAMILMQGLRLGGLGVGIGLVISFVASRGLTSSSIFVANFKHVSYAMFLAVALPLLLITVLATYPPARRASLVDPMRTLREE